MSSVSVESTVGNSQLYFSWFQEADDRRQSEHGSAVLESSDAAPRLATPHSPAPQPRLAQIDAPSRYGSNEPYRNGEKQIRPVAKPVKMGSLMIQLLKQYGITDREIEEAMARYARLNVQQLAS